MITWLTEAGSLGTLTERIPIEIILSATSTIGTVNYSLIAGTLPRGLILLNSRIQGSPTEVTRSTESRFVIRASDGTSVKDRTFSLSVDGADIPQWITEEGFLNVGPNQAYFVLDNSQVLFQLEARDSDVIAGENLEYFIRPGAGELPPGLTLSRSGAITGFTDPIFSLEFDLELTGGFDIGSFDTRPLDKPEAKSNGFDSFLYDNTTFDYNEPSQVPRRLSRFYPFSVTVTDGKNEITRLFKIYVVTEEFLAADNSLLQVATGIFTADASKDRIPLWITPPYLGKYRANNYVTLFLDVYDPPSLSGTITYFLLATNPDGSISELPPGMNLDSVTGDIAGKVPYQARVTKRYNFSIEAVNFPLSLANASYTVVGDWTSRRVYRVNEAVRFVGALYICIQANQFVVPAEGVFWTRGTSSAVRTFTVDLIGEIESGIQWISNSDLGTIKPNIASTIVVLAESQLYGGRVAYKLKSGILPPGLELLPNGLIQGKVKQFGDQSGNGLVRFIDGTIFDTNGTTFDRAFKFVVEASDSASLAVADRNFIITVTDENSITYANLYVRALQPKEKRLAWFNFITNSTIFNTNDLYRSGDPGFAVQTDLKIILFAGIESVQAVKYVQAMSRNHYRKRLLLGDVKVAEARIPDTQQVLYDMVYVDIVDEYEKNGKSISQTVELPDYINSQVLISYDAIKVDSDVPLVSDRDHQRIFPNSTKNMRSRIYNIGDRDREFLPLWMRTIQTGDRLEQGYVKALPLCYAKPGKGAQIASRIKANDFDFKSLDFTIDRYIIDVIYGEFQDKYLAFPQIGEKLP
jgi:hypothetical protein